MVHSVAEVLELEELVSIAATHGLVLSQLNVSKYFLLIIINIYPDKLVKYSKTVSSVSLYTNITLVMR